MHKRKNTIPNCKEDCEVGFVELVKENWECIGIVENYGLNSFTDGMGGINTSSIKNILEVECYEGEKYKNLFHDLVLYISTALSTKRNK